MPKATRPQRRAGWCDPTAGEATDDAQILTDSDEGPTTVYYLFTADHQLLYVGISATELGIARFQQHASDKDWWTEVGYISVEHMPTRTHALHREAAAIEALDPKHNVMRPTVGGCKNCGEPLRRRGGRECSACSQYRIRNSSPRPERLFAAVEHGV
jgi:hypothetical protein